MSRSQTVPASQATPPNGPGTPQTANPDLPMVQNGAECCTFDSKVHHAPPQSPLQNPIPDSALSLPPLTTTQQSAIDLLVSGRTVSSVARTLNVHRNTIHRWRLFHPTFRLELARKRQEIWGASADRFRALLRLAGTVFRDHLLSEDPAASIRAARSMLLLAGQGRFAPDPDPVDLMTLLNSHVRLMRPDSDSNAPISLEEHKAALHNLLLLADYRDDLP